MASQQLPDDAPNRSSVEVEQILPCTELGLDPRDFYASDSPVLDEYLDSGQESTEEFLECIDTEVQGDDQVESSIVCHIRLSYLTLTSQASWCEAFPGTSRPTTPVFAFSAPVLHFALTNCQAFIILADASAATNNSCSSLPTP
jgi:hypothetical protein